jgi:hypothetical protein
MQSHLLQLRDAVPTATWDQRPTGQKGANWPFSPSPQSPKLISARKPLGIRALFCTLRETGNGAPNCLSIAAYLDDIAQGRAPADLTVSDLARKLPMSWKEQEHQLDIRS